MKDRDTLFENYQNMSHLNCQFWHFPTTFVIIKVDLSGNTVWPQAWGFRKLAKLTNFGNGRQKYLKIFLSSQHICWMRLFLWFSNTVPWLHFYFYAISSIFALKMAKTDGKISPKIVNHRIAETMHIAVKKGWTCWFFKCHMHSNLCIKKQIITKSKSRIKFMRVEMKHVRRNNFHFKRENNWIFG